METFNEKKEKVAHNQFSIFAVGYGNFGGKRSSESAVPTLNPPKRSPDASVQQKTSEDQVSDNLFFFFFFSLLIYSVLPCNKLTLIAQGSIPRFLIMRLAHSFFLSGV